MQFINKTLVSAGFLLFPFLASSQSTYLQRNEKQENLLNRLEIKLQRNLDLNLSVPKPYSRRIAAKVGEYADSIQKVNGSFLSGVDQANVKSLLMNNSEWVKGDKSDFVSKHPLWNFFYKTKANMIEVNDKDFFLAFNPIYQGQISKEQDHDEMVFLNSKGLTFRGMIANRVGFSGYLTENQERGPRFVQHYIDTFQAVPGVGYYKKFKETAVDYFDGRGSINFTAAKYLEFQF